MQLFRSNPKVALNWIANVIHFLRTCCVIPSILSLGKCLFPAGQVVPHMTYGIPITRHHSSSWTIRACGEGKVLQGISSAQTKKTTVFKLEESKTLSLAINIYQPPPYLLEQCKWLTSASIHKTVPVLLRKPTWGKGEQMTTYSAALGV